ncbi:MAG: hypothetical protein ACRETD_01045 [Steroidobacteraceae bacterium]
MQERALRKILLIQAIEETDRNGEALPLLERTEATRAVLGNNSPVLETQAPLSSATEWFLIRRADILLRSLRERSPGIDHVLAVAGGATSLDRGTLVLAFVAGLVLSLLDGGRGINIFALPLIALIAWNLLVYLLLLGRVGKGGADIRKSGVGVCNAEVGVPSAAAGVPRSAWFGGFYTRWVRRRIDRLLGHSTRFNAPLAPGLRRFAGDWWDIAQPLFVLRARRLLHLAAALLAVGLVAGYFFRGFVLRSAAGWEGGGILGPETAYALLTVLYGPAALLSGIAIPGAAELARLRWSAPSLGGVGEPAGWIPLIAWTAGLYVVLPRLLAALLSTFGLWRLSRRLTLPSGVIGYVRTLFAAAHYGTELKP